MKSTVTEPKHRMIGFYPGVELRDKTKALMEVLNHNHKTSLSEQLRPALRQLIQKYEKEIEEYLSENKIP